MSRHSQLSASSRSRLSNRSTQSQVENERLRRELASSQIDLQTSERRLSRLSEKLEAIQVSKEELEDLHAAIEEKLDNAELENKELREQLEEKAHGDGHHLTKKDKEVEKLNFDLKEWKRNFRAFQTDLMSALGVNDLTLSRSVAEGGIGESSKTCGPKKLGTFLKKTAQSLTSAHQSSIREVFSLRSKLGAESLKVAALENEVQSLQAERKRMLDGFREHESQIEYLSNEIRVLRSFLQDELGKETEVKLKVLESENEHLQQHLARTKAEHEDQISQLAVDLQFEQDRYRNLLQLSSGERAEFEDRCKKCWEQQQQRFQDEFDALKANYESPLQISYQREAELQRQLEELEERYNSSKESWEEYRLNLIKQLEGWKDNYKKKCELVDNTRKEKEQMELLVLSKQTLLDQCQEMVNSGVEERLTLQKRIEALQNKLKEFLAAEESGSATNLHINFPNFKEFQKVTDSKSQDKGLRSLRVTRSVGGMKRVKETASNKSLGLGKKRSRAIIHLK